MAEKKTTRKARTRKKAAGDSNAPPPGEAPAYAHATKLRCSRCGIMMRADGTRDDGRIKRWVCPAPICRKRAETVGERV